MTNLSFFHCLQMEGLERIASSRFFSGMERYDIFILVLRTPRIARFMQASGLVALWLYLVEKFQDYNHHKKLNNMLHASQHGRESTPVTTSEAERIGTLRPQTNVKNDIAKAHRQSQSGYSTSRHQSESKLTLMNKVLQKRDHDEEMEARRNSLQGPHRDVFDYVGVGTGSFRRNSISVKGSQVGKEMHELTIQRVLLGVMVAVSVTVLFAPHEIADFLPRGMAAMHSTFVSLQNDHNANITTLEKAFEVLHLEEWNLYSYDFNEIDLLLPADKTRDHLREREKLKITVCTENDAGCSHGMLDVKYISRGRALYSLLTVILIMFIWYTAVVSFAGPITALIIIPIERMIKILNMLVKDPLGYQNSPKYKTFVDEGDSLSRHSTWNVSNLEGMET